jgi:cell division protein FtsN
MNLQRSASPHPQHGNFVIGLIVGLLVGLALALGVALYIAKVPVPFVNKVPQRTAEQDAAETEKNKNWDPNSALYGKPSVKQPGSSASGVVSALPAPAVPPTLPPPVAPATGQAPPDPAAILSGKPPAENTVSTKPGSDALSYFVQAGAFGRVEDAEAQRAKLALSGMAAKITEREQSGRTVYRVRLGPFEKREDASQMKEKLEGAGVESALVQVQK